MDLEQDMRTRWLPSPEQMELADAVLSAGLAERGVYTAHLLINKGYGWWTEGVQLVFLDGVFLTRNAVLDFVHMVAEKRHEEGGEKLVGGWAWHMRVGEAAVWDDIASEFPVPDYKLP